MIAQSHPSNMLTDVNNVFFFSIQSTIIELWHQKLGHLAKQRLSYINSIDNNKLSSTFFEVCSMSKQHRQPFTKTWISSIRIIELLHMDQWGLKWVFLTGAHYFLTIVDDFSRNIWTYFSPNKGVVGFVIVNFVSMIKN